MAAIAVPELWQLTDREAFYGYSFWPDIATRCFQGFLFSDGAAMIKHMGLQRVTTKQMMVHHALFFAVAYFATSGPYFRCAPLLYVSDCNTDPQSPPSITSRLAHP